MISKVYKVLTSNQKSINLISESGARIKYRRNEKTRPQIENSKLFAFINLAEAKDYWSQCSGERIWEGTAEIDENCNLKTTAGIRNDLREFWDSFNKGSASGNYSCPIGTVFCNWI